MNPPSRISTDESARGVKSSANSNYITNSSNRANMRNEMPSNTSHSSRSNSNNFANNN